MLTSVSKCCNLIGVSSEADGNKKYNLANEPWKLNSKTSMKYSKSANALKQTHDIINLMPAKKLELFKFLLFYSRVSRRSAVLGSEGVKKGAYFWVRDRLNERSRQRNVLRIVRQVLWRVWSWLRTNAGGMPNTCKSSGLMGACSLILAADGWVTRGQPALQMGITPGNRG